jgi:hypothetical protein
MVWNARGGLPKDAYDELTALVPKPRVLTWGSGDGVLVVGLSGKVALRDTRGWRITGWHEVDLARWDAESGILSWSGRTNERMVLTNPGRLPMLLKDRVEASILLSERVRAGTVTVQISARRDLDRPDAPILWSAVATDGRTLDRPGVREVVDRRLAELRVDLDG